VDDDVGTAFQALAKAQFGFVVQDLQERLANGAIDWSPLRRLSFHGQKLTPSVFSEAVKFV
jgi:hypothetical protein